MPVKPSPLAEVDGLPRPGRKLDQITQAYYISLYCRCWAPVAGAGERIICAAAALGPEGWRRAAILAQRAKRCSSLYRQRSMRPCSATRRRVPRSEEHTSELQSLMRISYAVFCLKKQK